MLVEEWSNQCCVLWRSHHSLVWVPLSHVSSLFLGLSLCLPQSWSLSLSLWPPCIHRTLAMGQAPLHSGSHWPSSISYRVGTHIFLMHKPDAQRAADTCPRDCDASSKQTGGSCQVPSPLDELGTARVSNLRALRSPVGKKAACLTKVFPCLLTQRRLSLRTFCPLLPLTLSVSFPFCFSLSVRSHSASLPPLSKAAQSNGWKHRLWS